MPSQHGGTAHIHRLEIFWKCIELNIYNVLSVEKDQTDWTLLSLVYMIHNNQVSSTYIISFQGRCAVMKGFYMQFPYLYLKCRILLQTTTVQCPKCIKQYFPSYKDDAFDCCSAFWTLHRPCCNLRHFCTNAFICSVLRTGSRSVSAQLPRPQPPCICCQPRYGVLHQINTLIMSIMFLRHGAII